MASGTPAVSPQPEGLVPRAATLAGEHDPGRAARRRRAGHGQAEGDARHRDAAHAAEAGRVGGGRGAAGGATDVLVVGPDLEDPGDEDRRERRVEEVEVERLAAGGAVEPGQVGGDGARELLPAGQHLGRRALGPRGDELPRHPQVVGLERLVDLERPEAELAPEVLLDGDEVGDEALDGPALDGRRVPLGRGEVDQQLAERGDGAAVGLVGAGSPRPRRSAAPMARLASAASSIRSRSPAGGSSAAVAARPPRTSRHAPSSSASAASTPSRRASKALSSSVSRASAAKTARSSGWLGAQVHDVTPWAESTAESLPRARRSRDLAVPSGRPRRAATSRKVRPPK